MNNRITEHPILEVPKSEEVKFLFDGKEIVAQRGITIAAALHQAGFPIHSHSITGRERSVQCGIGKCGACEMLVDGKITRVCITPVDNVKRVEELPKQYQPGEVDMKQDEPFKIYKTTVAIVGAGPAGLAAREILKEHNISNIIIDSNDKIGGQFVMQTHQFFFFEEKKKYGGMRGFDIAKTLAGDDYDGIMLQNTVWDVLEGKKLALKNRITDEISFVEADFLIVATGAVPFVPSFENDDIPGVYTAAVVQKMMNNEFTLMGKRVLTVGAGNIGYLTSYQLLQAGAEVVAIIEAMNHEGGFPVQANRIRRMGVPIFTSHTLVKAIPNKDHTKVIGAVIAECENFKPIPNTEKYIDNIDVINVCTGLLPDNKLLTKGMEVFGTACVGAGDVLRIGEGTSAVLRGKQAAYDIMHLMNVRTDYEEYLKISRTYIDSQQRPIRVLQKAVMPEPERQQRKPFVVTDCLYGFACNPCTFICPHDAITKLTTTSVPQVDYDKCIGCMKCVNHCPGLAIFGYDIKKNVVSLPFEYHLEKNTPVVVVNNSGDVIGEGVVENIVKGENKTHIAKVAVSQLSDNIELTDVKGFIPKDKYKEKYSFKNHIKSEDGASYVCFCEDIDMPAIMKAIGDRKSITIQELKHTTRIAMGVCRGLRCIPRLRQLLSAKGIVLENDPTPRTPMGNRVTMGDLHAKTCKDVYVIDPKKLKKVRAGVLIAGGGMAGSSLFRYFAEAGYKPILINNEPGSTWRCIAGGRPSFSIPEIADIATNNHELFKELQKVANIDYHLIEYVTFAHDEATYDNLVESQKWTKAHIVEPSEFNKTISPYLNKDLSKTYLAAQIAENCWQATPGKAVNTLRQIAMRHGGTLNENHKLIDLSYDGNVYTALVQDDKHNYVEYTVDVFVNALGANADVFAMKVGVFEGFYPVKHQAFITRRLPLMGVNGNQLGMLIDRRNYKGYIAVYGQQLRETGQIIICASPAVDAVMANKNLKTNTKDFFEVANEVFINWMPNLSTVSIQSAWAGYYTEPRMMLDTEKGLLIGLKGHGFMLSQYLAKCYVDKVMGREIPKYFDRLKVDGDGMMENAFK